jgi:hypothetical protein
MRIDRRLLFAGVFLLAIGGVLVAVDLGLIDTAILTDLLRLWPLAFVAIGVGIVLRRTDVSLASGLVAVAVPGLLIGSAFAVAPRFECGGRGEPVSVASERGAFVGPAQVSVIAGCGTFAVTTANGSGWQLAASNTAGRAPIVETTARSLAVDSIGADEWDFLSGGRNAWDLALPTTVMDSLSLEFTASRAEVGLPDARVGRLVLTANASDMVVDATKASIDELSGEVNIGSLAITLPADDVAGSIRLGGGELRLCAPEGLGLRLTMRGEPREVEIDGLQQSGSVWQSPDYASASSRADLDVHVNFGSVEVDPIGGCK